MMYRVYEWFSNVGEMIFKDPVVMLMVALVAFAIALVCQGLILKTLEDDVRELQARVFAAKEREEADERTEKEGDEA